MTTLVPKLITRNVADLLGQSLLVDVNGVPQTIYTFTDADIALLQTEGLFAITVPDYLVPVVGQRQVLIYNKNP